MMILGVRMIFGGLRKCPHLDKIAYREGGRRRRSFKYSRRAQQKLGISLRDFEIR